MRKFVFLFVTLLVSLSAFAQHAGRNGIYYGGGHSTGHSRYKEERGGFEMIRPIYAGLTTSAMRPPFSPSLGISCGFEGQIGERFLTGLHVAIGVGNVNKTFGHAIASPGYNFTEFGIISEFRLIDEGLFKMNLYTINSFNLTELGDYDTTHFDGEYYHPKDIATNVYYSPRLGAGFQAGWAYFRCDYDLVFGKTRFANPSDFMTFNFLVGLRIDDIIDDK